MQLEQQVKTVMSRVFNVPAETISPATSPDNLEAWDWWAR